MFFIDQRHQFFKPLTTKYRQQVVECLSLMHQRLYGATAEYGRALTRIQVLDIFEEALARAPVMEQTEVEVIADGLEENEQRFKNLREQASWVLKLLVEHGWIEKQVDTATLQSSYPLSRAGRLFALSLVEVDSRQVRTRHRNTRNTLNALEAFTARGEVHDLLDALEYSERIIADFTDVISEIEERKRELVREVESQLLIEQATEHFFDFMEKRFQPDVSVRLSADSVEKHRDNIRKAIAKIRRKKTEFKTDVEIRLREMAPELIVPGQSVLWNILDTIELRMRNAAEIMLPALRQALQSFTKRADIIIRQLGYLHASGDDQWVQVCQFLASQSEDEYNARLTKAGAAMATTNVRLVDPAQLKLQQRKKQRVVQTSMPEAGSLDADSQRELLIQSFLDQAFVMNNNALHGYIKKALGEGRRVSTRDLPVNDARDLLALAHIVELGAVNNSSSEYRFKVSYENKQYQSRYFSAADEFTIELESLTHD